MGNSTTSLQNVLDYTSAQGIPIPTQNAAGYGVDLAINLANDVMGDIIAERFNWKWNRLTAAPFYTNSWQQDYPQIGLTNVGWIEDADRTDINSTSIPKPLRQLTARRQLSRASMSFTPIKEICWMYNSQLSYGTWPGNSVTFNPLIVASPGVVKQNPIMSMIDPNGNLLIVTTLGTTAATGNGPSLPMNSAEGTTVTDGTVVWTVVSPTSQGFRVNPLPGASGPVYQIIAYYQMSAIPITSLGQLLNPIPPDFQRCFQAGYEAYCLKASPNPADRARFMDARNIWLKSMDDIRKQGDREADAYAMLPASSPVAEVYPCLRNPQDPSQPY